MHTSAYIRPHIAVMSLWCELAFCTNVRTSDSLGEFKPLGSLFPIKLTNFFDVSKSDQSLSARNPTGNEDCSSQYNEGSAFVISILSSCFLFFKIFSLRDA